MSHPSRISYGSSDLPLETLFLFPLSFFHWIKLNHHDSLSLTSRRDDVIPYQPSSAIPTNFGLIQPLSSPFLSSLVPFGRIRIEVEWEGTVAVGDVAVPVWFFFLSLFGN
jgi:hypothetical protein